MAKEGTNISGSIFIKSLPQSLELIQIWIQTKTGNSCFQKVCSTKMTKCILNQTWGKPSMKGSLQNFLDSSWLDYKNGSCSWLIWCQLYEYICNKLNQMNVLANWMKTLEESSATQSKTEYSVFILTWSSKFTMFWTQVNWIKTYIYLNKYF